MAVELDVSDYDGSVLAVLTGELASADTGALRRSLESCLAGQPDALLIDLGGLVVDDPLALTLLLTLSADAARWPGVPVLFCGPSDAVRTMLGSAEAGTMPLFATVTAGREHAQSHHRLRPVVTEELLPLAGAARHARNVVTEACLRWDLPGLVAPATLIVSELVSNAVDHAGTAAQLRLALSREHLTIAVRDGSAEPPVRPGPAAGMTERGRGLMLVAATADSWGWSPVADGKVVWATLPR